MGDKVKYNILFSLLFILLLFGLVFITMELGSYKLSGFAVRYGSYGLSGFALGDGSSVERSISQQSVAIGGGVNVTLHITIGADNHTYYAIEEVFPDGWNLIDEGGGSVTGNSIRWFYLGDRNANNASYNYKLSAPSTAGTYSFSGQYFIEGMNNETEINGVNTLTVIQTCQPITEVCDSVDNDCDGEVDEGCDVGGGDSGGGGGGGVGGGSGAAGGGSIISISQNEIEIGVEKTIVKKDKLKLIYSNTTTYLEVKSLSAQNITIGEKTSAELQSVNYDLTNDGKEDITITIKRLNPKNASIRIGKILEREPPHAQNRVKEETEVLKDTEKSINTETITETPKQLEQPKTIEARNSLKTLFYSSTLIIVILTIVVVILTSKLKAHQKNAIKQNSNPSTAEMGRKQQVKEYISKVRNYGLTDEQIRNNLRGSGWDEQTINQMIGK